jgi:hypothetical protein
MTIMNSIRYGLGKKSVTWMCYSSIYFGSPRRSTENLSITSKLTEVWTSYFANINLKGLRFSQWWLRLHSDTSQKIILFTSLWQYCCSSMLGSVLLFYVETFSLRMEAVVSSKTSVITCRAAWYHSPEDHNMNLHQCWHIRSCISCVDILTLQLFNNKKLWEELITYFPSKQHGPHRKRHVQQFFYCFMCICYHGNVFPSSCVATREGEIHRQQGDLISLLLFFQTR